MPLTVSALAACMVLAVGTAAAQAQGEPTGSTVIAATQARLWVADATDVRTLLAQRTDLTPFAAPQSFNGRLLRIAVSDTAATLFFESGAVVQVRGTGGPEPRADMPRHRAPLDAVVAGGEVYALALSSAARELYTPRGGDVPFSPGASSISLIRLESRGWAGFSPLPDEATSVGGGTLRPRLLVLNGAIHAFWAEGETIVCAALDLPTGAWRRGTELTVPGLGGFAPVLIGRVPALVAVEETATGERLRGYRMLAAGPGDPGSEWLASEIQLSGWAGGPPDCRFVDAVGFNQHVAIAQSGADGRRAVRFARFGEAPAEPTLLVPAVFEPPVQEQLREMVGKGTPVLVVAVLVMLLAFRRTRVDTIPTLPATVAPAFYFQRVIAAVIDLVPISVLTAAWTGVSWQDAVRGVADWAVAGVLPVTPVLLWWLWTSAGYFAYSLLMELLAARTVGKLLVGTRVCDEAGGRADWRQVLLRNAIRALEVHPPFWLPLLVIFLWGRGRRRLGDLFARTLVLRSVAPDAATSPPPADDSAASKPDPPNRDGESG
ncbi:MAG: RDD family protein [Planctomycetia bacterium]|nr:MAG: RDD family protein [Planctomycetia bacterium]